MSVRFGLGSHIWWILHTNDEGRLVSLEEHDLRDGGYFQKRDEETWEEVFLKNVRNRCGQRDTPAGAEHADQQVKRAEALLQRIKDGTANHFDDDKGFAPPRRESLCLLSDSYKLTHWPMYPPETEYLYAYFESRGSVGPENYLNEACFVGVQPTLMKYLTGPVVTGEDVREAAEFAKNHFGQNVFNQAGWEHLVGEHHGHLPVSIRAVPEGTIVSNHNVLMTVENTCRKSAWLVNFLESLLVQAWYPTTIASMGRETKKLIGAYLQHTSGNTGGLEFKLHDFGFRGASSVESAGLGGCAHLINFSGTDNLCGIRTAQEYYGAGMAGFSIPATEHSIMTARGEDGEDLVLDQILNAFPEGVVATVGDSYDMYRYIDVILAAQREKILARRGTLVVRPDSGDPIIVVLEVLERLGKVFGTTLNARGYKVLPSQVRVIQGDGVDHTMIRQILEMMQLKRWSTENIAFGMGGALLQRLDRDTMKFAFKASEITISGVAHPIFKNPVTGPDKASKRGRLKLIKNPLANGVTHKTVSLDEEGEDVLVEVFRDGEIIKKHTFDEVRERAGVGFAS